MSETKVPHKKIVKKRVHKRRSLKTRLKGKLSKHLLGKTKSIYILLTIALAIFLALVLIWYINKEEPAREASLPSAGYDKFCLQPVPGKSV